MTRTSRYLACFFGFLLLLMSVSSAAASTCAESTNVALAVNGATATASSSYSGFAASGAINGDRKGLFGWQDGYWSTASTAQPAWLEVQFNGSKTITEVDVVTIQNNFNAPVEPTESTSFSLYGLTSYQVHYWTGSGWATIAGGSVTGNDKVWRKFIFAPITTTKIRVLATSSPDGHSRLAEVEAWTGPSTVPRYNLALGATATASSQWSGWGPSSTVNGDRKSLNAGTDGGWVDAGPAQSFPDFLQVDFGTNKIINEIDVFTLQDNWGNPAEPTESMTFTQWGLTAYELQYWNGSSWVQVPGATVTGNNKIWRRFTFSPVTTNKIQVKTTASVDGFSRITEVEAYGPQVSTCGSIARLDPLNATGGGGENPLSQNFNWNVPLVGLPGRAGLDLNVTLSYNSLVWTRNNTHISFNEDNGFPSPGFRLGFPVIQQLHYNGETGKHGFLLIGRDGTRTELRQVGNSLLFEAADSSHLLLDASDMTLRSADGVQFSYVLMGSQFNCTQIKDRNGNYISVEYLSGRVDKVIDTLGRQIKFNYDGSGLPVSITQTWNQGQPNQAEHRWAEFSYTDTPIQTDFPNLIVYGPPNNTTIKTLSKVTLPDDSHFDFSYTSWGQVWKIAYVAADNGNHVLNYRAYKLPGSPLLTSSPQTDCPRFTERHDWAKYWNGDTDGTVAGNEEAVTTFSGPVNDTWIIPGDSQAVTGKRTDVTSPDGTVNKTYFVEATGTPRWNRGLPAMVETSSDGEWQRKVKTTWTQDNTTVDYPLNPRVVETNVYDRSENHARTEIMYEQFMLGNNLSCWLPRDLLEYAANGTTVLRTTRTNYNMHADYTNRRILGLPSEKLLYDGTVTGTLMSKTEFIYDGNGSIQGTETPVQHANPSPATPRGNVSTVKRYNVNNPIEATETIIKYNKAGAVVSSMDASDHEVIISYTDSFSDGVPRGTFAYPTVVQDPDDYSSTSKYNYDFGAVTYNRTPLPNQTANLPGPEQTFTFDTIGRLQQITNPVNNAYTRFVYSSADLKTETYATIHDGLGEARSVRITDGNGRTIASATQHPGSTGGYSGVRTVYDVMGHVIETSNPTETEANGTPFEWNTTGDDGSAGWIYTEQTYDWKGRPLVTTNPSMTSNPADTTTRILSYSGCGCAGGEVVTITDEGTIDGGTAKRRQQKIYSDVLGRTIRTEILTWEGGSVYSATVNTYNARDQVTDIKQYAGPVGSTFQTTSMSYDGYGRLQAKQAPEQTASTIYTYNSDDTLLSVTDARGAATVYTRNGRHLVTGVSYTVPSSSNIPVPASVSYTYDAAGNRTEMTDGLGSTTYAYNSLSRMTSETRNITQATPASYTISYQYNLAGQLTTITDPNNNTINYTRDLRGRTSAITGSSFGGVSTYISSMSYRASGAVKQVNYGNGKTLNATYNDRLKAETFEIAGLMSKTYEYYADGTLKFSSETLDHRFDRLYRWDHVGRIKEASSGAEARGEGVTTNRPYKQLFAYDALGHLTERTKYWWFLGPDTSSDSYTNNRHDSVGQLWQYDADGNIVNMPGTGYIYDAGGRIASMMAGTPSTATLSRDGDGKKVKSVEAVWNPETESDITTTSYFIHSTVLGRVLTENVYSDDPDITVPDFFSRTFVYGGSGGVIAYQMSFGSGSGEVWWAYRDPSNASYRTSTNTSQPGEQQELDPTGANHGVTDPISQSIPDEGLLAPFGASYNSSQPSVAYSVDGVRVPLDYFIQMLQVAFQGEFGLNEALARQTADEANYEKKWVPSPPRVNTEPQDVGEGDIVVIDAVHDGYWVWRAISATPSLSWLVRWGAGTSQNGRRPHIRIPGQLIRSACHVMADLAGFVAHDAVRLTNNAQSALEMFDREFSLLYHGPQMNSFANMNRARQLARDGHSNSVPDQYVGAGGFRTNYKDSEHPTEDQTHHFSAHVSMGINGRSITNFGRNILDNAGDANLGEAAYEIGAELKAAATKGNVFALNTVGYRIRSKICDPTRHGLTYDEWKRIRSDILRR